MSSDIVFQLAVLSSSGVLVSTMPADRLAGLQFLFAGRLGDPN